MDLRFWLSIMGVFFISIGTGLIWLFLKKQDSSSNLAPTLGADTLSAPLKKIYLSSTLAEFKDTDRQRNAKLFREIRRTIFELQMRVTENLDVAIQTQDLDNILEDFLINENDIDELFIRVQAIRIQKKSPEGLS